MRISTGLLKWLALAGWMSRLTTKFTGSDMVMVIVALPLNAPLGMSSRTRSFSIRPPCEPSMTAVTGGISSVTSGRRSGRTTPNEVIGPGAESGAGPGGTAVGSTSGCPGGSSVGSGVGDGRTRPAEVWSAGAGGMACDAQGSGAVSAWKGLWQPTTANSARASKAGARRGWRDMIESPRDRLATSGPPMGPASTTKGAATGMPACRNGEVVGAQRVGRVAGGDDRAPRKPRARRMQGGGGGGGGWGSGGAAVGRWGGTTAWTATYALVYIIHIMRHGSGRRDNRLQPLPFRRPGRSRRPGSPAGRDPRTRSASDPSAASRLRPTRNLARRTPR